MRKRTAGLCALILAVCTLSSCSYAPEPTATIAPTPTPDPHEGMVYVNTGGESNWVYPVEGFPVSDFKAEDFASENGVVSYTGDRYASRLGIDVSFYQGDIDWEKVKAAGVEFAMIRCGFRGSSEGTLYEDEKFRQNMDGALEAGLDVGVYFFSQTTGAREAAEEAEYVLSLIDGYELTMPVAFDWEPLSGSRAGDISSRELTVSAVVFCEIMKDAGYESAVYLYRKQGYYDYDLAELKDYTLWIGSPGDYPDFYYAHELWQFSFTGRIDGIDHDVDLNLQLTPKSGF